MLQWAEAGGVLLGPGFVDRRNVEQVRSSGAVAVGAWWLESIMSRIIPTRRAALGLAALICAALICAGCAEAALERLGLGRSQPLTVSFIVHGTAQDPFWQEVRAGAESAAQAFDASISWHFAPQTEERVQLIEDAIQQRFDVIVVTLSDPAGMEQSVRDAVVFGATVYVINAGVQYATGFGADAFFGMVETVAGLAAGERLAAAGVSKLLCVIHEPGNESLVTRCEQAEFRIGEMIRLFIDPLDRDQTEGRILEALTQGPGDRRHPHPRRLADRRTGRRRPRALPRTRPRHPPRHLRRR